MADPNWDDDGPRLTRNLAAILTAIETNASSRPALTLSAMRDWHRQMMDGLILPHPGYAGCFRCEGAAVGIEVEIGGVRGVSAAELEDQLDVFERSLRAGLARLDAQVAPGADLTPSQLREALTLCAWAHGEWVRIHPFVNGSGRTARLWVNAIAMRYSLPPFMRLRPRPGADYSAAAAASMHGSWKSLMPVLMRMLDEELDR